MNFLLKYYQHITDGLLIGILVIFSLIFLPPFSQLLINADSYAIMLTAEFLHQHGTFGAQLGEWGDIFSPIFYRGGFSLFIYLLSPLFHYNWLVTGQYIVQITYFLSIVLVFLVVKKIFSSRWAGFFASLLAIFCYIFTQWSTILMSETPTIFLTLFSLFFLVYGQSRPYWLYLSAIVLGVAFMFRAEMIILLIPFSILIYIYYKNNLNIFFYIIFSFIIWFIYLFSLYIFNPDPAFWLSQQINIFTFTLGTHQLFIYTILLLLLFLFLLIRWPLFAFIPAAIFVYLAINISLDFTSVLSPFYSYLYHDLPIIITGLAGLIWLYRHSKAMFLFFTFYCFPLLLLYFSRGEYRYYVHTIMPLIMLGGYFIYQIIGQLSASLTSHQNKLLFFTQKVFYFLILALIIAGEIYHYTRPDFLPAESYEQVVIEATQKVINSHYINQNNIVICSVFSEAIYFSTHISAQDCFNGREDIDRHPDQTKLIIVEEDISRHQPEFSQYLIDNYSDQLIAEQWLVTPYIEKNTTSLPKYPVRWYLILGNIKN
ncbi:MAG: glycosyltransferase family 39 protein [Patescibacteria group bacterium]